MPMAKPKNADFINEEKISRYVIDSATSLKNNRKLELLMALTITKDPSNATTSVYTTRIGTISVVAITRVTTKYENGLVPDTSMASICSETCMLPNSAPILEPNFPAQIS